MASVPSRPECSVMAPDVNEPVCGRMPVHPGRFLDTRYLRPLKITQQELAKILGVSRRRINELVQGRRGLTPDTAVRLASYFGTNARFWMDMQTNWDLFHAMDAGNAIQPLQTSS